ncbi:putative leucine-rich repeat receptor-like protein kinase [Heracleum sosnowskyi]|uniref:non-specific serine/threonine protein kinase n=1 Tax=Heracleum sosnowskyi TaxID=360622 RepID=A0AAD8IBF7_9APIA|nr:putative leucine-rich repeat receptor-like protein kinase [Heracleum sosnowskyi]
MASFSCTIYILQLAILSLAVAEDAHNSSLIEREALLSTGWWDFRIFPSNIATHHCNELEKLNFSSITYLETLDLSFCELNGSIPYQIGMLSKLKYLSFRGNYLSGELPSSFGNLTQLQTLDLYGCKLNELEKLNFSSFPYLQTLDLSYCGLAGSIPYQCGMLSKLNYLSLYGNDLSGTLPFIFLTTLNLSYCGLDGSIPYQIGMLSKLKDLSLQNNHLTGKLSNLVRLDLSGNQLKGEVPIALGSLTELNYLNLSYNRLTGSIPVFQNCGSLLEIDLSQNMLSGHIPEGFGNCSSLEYVYLAGNNFTGSVPYTLCGFSNLHSFDLKQNCPDLTSHKKRTVFLVLCIVLPITIGVPSLILAIVCFGRPTRTEKKNKINDNNGDLCSVWNFDGIIAYEDILRATNNFDIRYCIGTGGYGSVYEARLPSVFEYLEKLASLFCALREDAHAMELDCSKRVDIVKGIAHALSYMHHDCTPPIVHRDISSKNILLNYNMEAFVADFGVSRLLDPDSSNQTVVAGTYGYIAPGYITAQTPPSSHKTART